MCAKACTNTSQLDKQQLSTWANRTPLHCEPPSIAVKPTGPVSEPGPQHHFPPVLNPSLPQSLVSSTPPVLLSSSTPPPSRPQLLPSSTPGVLNPSCPQPLSSSTPPVLNPSLHSRPHSRGCVPHGVCTAQGVYRTGCVPHDSQNGQMPANELKIGSVVEGWLDGYGWVEGFLRQQSLDCDNMCQMMYCQTFDCGDGPNDVLSNLRL